MKNSNSNSLLNSINDRNKNDIKFESMKNIFHNPLNKIKSKHLLSCFTRNKYKSFLLNKKRCEYSSSISQKKKQLHNISKILNQTEKIINNYSNINSSKRTSAYNYKIIDSDYSSHNNKDGLYSPLSYELSKKNFYIDQYNNKSTSNNIYNNYINNIKNKIKNINLNKNNDYKTIQKIETKNQKTNPFNHFNINSYNYIIQNKKKRKSCSNSKKKLFSEIENNIIQNKTSRKKNMIDIKSTKNINNINDRYSKTQRNYKMNNLINNYYSFAKNNNDNNIKKDVFKTILP
jgi:hypothetical protein